MPGVTEVKFSGWCSRVHMGMYVCQTIKELTLVKLVVTEQTILYGYKWTSVHVRLANVDVWVWLCGLIYPHILCDTRLIINLFYYS